LDGHNINLKFKKMKKVLMSLVVLMVLLIACEKAIKEDESIKIYVSEGYTGYIPAGLEVIGTIEKQDLSDSKSAPVYAWKWVFLSCDGCQQSGGGTWQYYNNGANPPRCPHCGRDEQSSPRAWFGWALFPY
jgi:hypothetical protein